MNNSVYLFKNGRGYDQFEFILHPKFKNLSRISMWNDQRAHEDVGVKNNNHPLRSFLRADHLLRLKHILHHFIRIGIFIFLLDFPDRSDEIFALSLPVLKHFNRHNCSRRFAMPANNESFALVLNLVNQFAQFLARLGNP